MNKVECHKRLGELLQAQNDRITQANAYLLVIKNAIAEDRIDNLQQSLVSPDLAIDDIEQLERQRLELLTQTGFGDDDASLEKCIAWCDDDSGQLAELYQQLIKNLYDLRHSIQVNSLLVHKGQERVRRSIGILTGSGGNAFGKTYGRKGQAIDPVDRRGIAIA